MEKETLRSRTSQMFIVLKSLHLQLSLNRYLHVSLMKIVCIMFAFIIFWILKLTQFCTNIPIFKYKCSYNLKRHAKCSSPELLDPLLSVCSIHEPWTHHASSAAAAVLLSTRTTQLHHLVRVHVSFHLLSFSSHSHPIQVTGDCSVLFWCSEIARIQGEARIHQGPSERTLLLL